MKKIIAISVMFALIAGAVFADTAVSGAVETRFSLAKQQGNPNDATGTPAPDPVMGGSIGAAQIRLTGSNTEGTLGGLFNFRNTDTVRSPTWFHRVFVWWKPIEQIKVFLGIDQDGLFDTANILGWSFHAGDNDYLFNHHWDFWRQIFPGNWDGFGLAVSFYPMPGLDINLVLPTGGINWPQATNAQITKTPFLTDPDGGNNYVNGGWNGGMIPGRLRVSGSYALDFGKISFAYIGGTEAIEKGVQFGTIARDNNGLLGLSAVITAVEGLAIQLGGSIVLTDPDMLISAGFGVAYTGEGFGVKARAGLVKQGDAELFITGNVMPFFAVGEKGQVLVDIGFTKDGNKDPGMGWYVTPAYRLNMEGGAFKIGIQVYNNIAFGGNIGVVGTVMDTNNTSPTYGKQLYKGDFVKWNIPMLLAFNF